MKTLVLFLALLCLAMAGCKKCYRCNQPEPLVTVCRNSVDTVWFVSYKGNKIDEQRIQQYVTLGYVCTDTIVDYHFAGSIADNNCLSYEEYDRYTWQGYDCYQSNVVQ